jgi:potassium-dependent mechanosensitive channel
MNSSSANSATREIREEMNRLIPTGRTVKERLVFSTIAFLIVWAVPHARSEMATEGAQALHKTRQDVAARIEELSNRDQEDSKTKKADEEIVASLRSLDTLYAQREAWIENKQKLEAQLAADNKALDNLDKFTPDEPKPYSFLLLERLKDEQETEKERERALKSNVNAAEQLLKAAHDELNVVGRQTAKGQQGAATEDDATTEGELAPAKLPGLLGRAKVAAKQAEIEVHTLRLELCRVKQKQLAKKIEVVAKDSTFTEHDLKEQYARLTSKEAELKAQRRRFESRFQELEESKKKDQRAENTKASPQQTEAAAAAWRRANEAIQNGIVILDGRIEDLASLRTLWKRRYTLMSKPPARAQLAQWRDDAEELRDRFRDEARALENQREVVHGNLVRASELEESQDAATEWVEFEQERLRELRELIEATLLDIKPMERVVERFRGELKTSLEKSRGTLDDIQKSLDSLIGMEVAGTDEKSVTVGKLLLLISMVAVGIFLAYSLSRIVGRTLLPKLGIGRGKATAIRSMLFYFLCVVWGVLTFQVLSIPLAAFAFVGGAAAIAIGFGSQDIMNNFMSGLILLSEQPIRVGDVIELGSVQGVVQHIGMRSTRLRTQSNHELIVPNKSLLDEQVTNFTLSDNVVRRSVTMTIERSVPIQEAKEKMLQVAQSHDRVLKSPAPVVLLKEVDNYYETSMFEIQFAMHLHNFIECEVVQSKILEEISELFPSASAAEKSAESSPDSAAEPADNGTSLLKNLKKLNRAAIAKELKKAQLHMHDQ